MAKPRAGPRLAFFRPVPEPRVAAGRLRRIVDGDGRVVLAQLVGAAAAAIEVKGAWAGRARLYLPTLAEGLKTSSSRSTPESPAPSRNGAIARIGRSSITP